LQLPRKERRRRCNRPAPAAALAFPDRKVLVATGDGAIGFNAMEIDIEGRLCP
jgi:hypothetical protein